MCTMHGFALFLVLNNPEQQLKQDWNPQGSHTGTLSQTDDAFDELPDVLFVNPRHSRRRPGRTEEGRGKYKSL